MYQYKQLLKEEIKAKQVKDPSFTLKKIAAELGVQYSYLSKLLNQPSHHFNEDHLFHLSVILDLSTFQNEKLLLLKAYETSQSDERREFLSKKIEQLNLRFSEKETEKSNSLNDDATYLFDPLNIIVHCSLSIKKYADNPLLLCEKFTMTINDLKKRLRLLSRLGYLSLDEDGISVSKIIFKKLHYGKDHPFMRVHQNLMKSKMNASILNTNEADKISYLMTLTFDDHSFNLVKKEFQIFYEKVMKIRSTSKNTHLYQLGFDFFKWI